MHKNMKIIFYILSVLIILTSCSQKVKTNKENTDDKMDIILPKQSQCEMLASDSIMPEKSSVFLDASGRICLLVDSVVFYIEAENKDSIEQPMKFFNSFLPNEICCFSDGTILFSENTFLSQIINEKSKILMEFPSKDFHIEKAGEKGVYVSTYDSLKKSSNLYLVNKDEMTAHKLLEDSLPIVVTGSDEITAIALDKSVYLLHNGDSKLIFRAQEPIKKLVFAPTGFFFATENNVGYFDSKINIIFLKKSILNMLSFNDKLYLLMKNGALYKITHTEYFNGLSNLIH